jgi:phosphoenolpyruvate synthase/pyruvate phosphate dikinase
MSVVLQEMVAPAAAGVIFTADPLTGEEGKITITANWGLGERLSQILFLWRCSMGNMLSVRK